MIELNGKNILKMKNKFNKNDLINFEKNIFENYSYGVIRAPVHLVGSIDGSQEEFLIKLFNNKINNQDWIFGTHRSHYHSILKSQNKKWVKGEIFAKRSSHLNSKYHKIFTSAIVGGILPIALGTAFALKQKKSKNKVWCFIGDMAANMGIMWECLRYAKGEKLPITFIVEDNTWGVYTPTQKVWKDKLEYRNNKYIYYYKYKRRFPHYGIGSWVTF